MNPKLAGLIILGVIIVAGIIISLGIWLVQRNAGVRQAEYKKMRKERNAAEDAVKEVEKLVNQYREIDHPLASALRPTLDAYTEKKMEIRR